MTIAEIFTLSDEFIGNLLREELVKQGHHLTGKLEESIKATISQKGPIDRMEGFALHYAEFVRDGVRASSASNAQAPFLIEYFEKRGLSAEEAVGAAFATIKVWTRQGMPTVASLRFSQTGSRKDFVNIVFTEHAAEIDQFVSSKIDQAVDELFKREKSETI